MKSLHILIIAYSICFASAAEDQNVAAFIKAFPSAKALEVQPEETVQHYTIDATISVEDIAARISKTANAKISILSAKDPKVFPAGEALKDMASANLLMGGQFMCLLIKNQENDKHYTATVMKAIDITVMPDSGDPVQPGGRESNIDMRLPSAPKEPKK
jgi:hypothetical protein